MRAGRAKTKPVGLVGQLFRPAGPALDEAALGDPPVEGMEDTPAGGRPRRVSAFTVTAVHA